MLQIKLCPESKDGGKYKEFPLLYLLTVHSAKGFDEIQKIDAIYKYDYNQFVDIG